jgi:hypothetical protein
MRFIYLLLLYPFLLFSQSEFVDKNYFGLNSGFSYSGNNIISGIGGNLGFSILGLVDLNTQYVASSIDRDFDHEDFESILFYIGYNIKRQNNRSNLKLVLGYFSNSPSDVSGPMLGLIFSYRVVDKEKFKIIPSLGLTYGFLFAPKQDFNFSDVIHVRSVGLDGSMLLGITNSLHFIVSPSISHDLENSNGSLVWGIYTGILFSSPVE